MGNDSFFRNLLRMLCARAFYPRDGNAWPDLSRVRTFVDDANNRLRSYGLEIGIHGETTGEIQRWGDVLIKLERELCKVFSERVERHVFCFDGHVPPSKGAEQHKRREQWLSKEREKDARRLQANPNYRPHAWPTVDDGKPWFRSQDACTCTMNGVYYSGPIVKRKWYSFVTEHLLYQMRLPLDTTLVIDSGARKDQVLRRPVQVRIQHDCGECSDAAALALLAAEGAAIVQRLVEPVPDEPSYNTFTEADDRMIFWAYKATLEWGGDVVVASEDGDTLQALMATYSTRHTLAKHLPSGQSLGRIFWRRHEEVGRVLDGGGRAHPVKQPEIVDVDELSEAVAAHYAALLADGVAPERREQELSRCDPILLFGLLSLMRAHDYGGGFPGLSGINIIRGAMARPDLCRRVLCVHRPPLDLPLPGARSCPVMERAGVPVVCLVHAPTFRELVKACYHEAYTKRERVIKNGSTRMASDVSPSVYPVPDDAVLDAAAARLSWSLDKMANAGRPGYRLDDPLRRTGDTDRSIYGYETYDHAVTDEATQRTRLEKRVRHVERGVEPLTYYGVTQDWFLRHRKAAASPL